MSCSEWHLQISAYIDGSLRSVESDALREHLQICADCAAFYKDHLTLHRTFQTELPDLDPPPRIWSRIEEQLSTQTKTASWDFSKLFRMPRLGYAGAAFVFFLAVSLYLSDSPDSVEDEMRYLAELDAFQIEVKGNPFLQDIQAENPFMKLGQYETGNPFKRLGGSQQ